MLEKTTINNKINKYNNNKTITKGGIMKHLLYTLSLTFIFGNFAQAANVPKVFCSHSYWPATVSDVQGVLNSQSEADLNQSCGAEGHRAIHFALMQNADFETIKTLVTKGADVTIKNAAGENAVYLALQHPSQEVYQYVLNAATQTNGYRTAILEAAIEEIMTEETARLHSFQNMPSFNDHANNDSENFDLYIQQLEDSIEELKENVETFEARLATEQVEQNKNALQDRIKYNNKLLTYYTHLIEHYQNVALHQQEHGQKVADYYTQYYSNYTPDPWHRNAPVGVYVSFDVGTVLKTMFDLNNTSDGLPTNCDTFLPPSSFSLPLTHTSCMNYADRWKTPFETQVGVTAGVMLGYGFQPFSTDKVTLRVEAEYARRQISGNNTWSSAVLGPKDSEFAFTHESFSELNTNQYFANIYADFPKLLSKLGAGLHNLTPYVGFGFGNLDPNMDYTSVWYRHKEGESLSRQGVNPNAAGTISVGNFKFEGDNSPATQWIFGADYTLTKRIKLGLRVRMMQIHQEFTSSDHYWQLLRNHQSRTSPHNGRPITYNTSVDELNFSDVTMQLKVFLGKRSKKPTRTSF